MRRRSLIVFGILLLCIFIGSCNKNNTADVLITQDQSMNIDKEGTLNEDTKMSINDVEENVVEVLIENEEILSETINEPLEQVGSMDQVQSVNPKEFNEQVRTYSAGSVINISEFNREILNSLFYVEELNQEIIDRITGKSYKEGSDIPYTDFRYIRVLHTGFDGLTHIGELIVNKAIAEDVVEIFRELYNIKYPIERILLIDEYDADDLKSMADNNSSAFNYRFVEGTTRRSVHSDGLAIDINPLYNPYVRTRAGKLEVLPEDASEYVDRTKDNIYYISKDDPCYRAFVSRGFTWGGEWKNSKDYQHFEKKLSD